ncbi:MAG: response regulator [Acidobacteria bacterium]|nr:response regulator [Acidobacteriota bacterium]
MSKVTSKSLRGLLVEDHPLQLAAMERYLRQIVEEPGNAHEIFKMLKLKGFEIHTAACSNDARRLLEQAVTERRPYDLLLTDLSLPLEVGGRSETTNKGLSIIKETRAKGAARKVIVVSQYSEMTEEAFRAGSFDFIAKPFDKEALQKQVLIQIYRLVSEESDRILNERVAAMSIWAERAIAHRFHTVFFTMCNAVTRTADEIASYAKERYGLDAKSDAQESLMRQLQAHTTAVANARQDWAHLQSPLATKDSPPQEASLEELMKQIEESLAFCLTVKEMQLSYDSENLRLLSVFTYEQDRLSDVQSVLQEVILGGLAELPDYGPKYHVKMSATASGELALLRFADNLPSIAQADADVINEGQTLVTHSMFKRSWGLSVAQYIALLGGGKLTVEPYPAGNVITYRLPLALGSQTEREQPSSTIGGE